MKINIYFAFIYIHLCINKDAITFTRTVGENTNIFKSKINQLVLEW